MILIDANLLVYAHVTSFLQHKRTRIWLDAQINGTVTVGLPWASILSFVRLVTNPRIFEQPETIAGAWKQIEEWLDCPTVWLPQPTERHREILDTSLTRNSIDEKKCI
ncbi:MAG: TA system VapC family ribonuclease toxin [bacterium]